MCRLPNALLAVFDTALCLFIFFPLAVLHWRGTWDLLDYYIIPDDLFYSSWVTLCAGGAGCVLCHLIQPMLHRCAVSGGKISEGIVTRLYMYIFSWAVLCYWRGVWNLMDLYMSDEIPNSLLFYVLGVALAALFRSMRTIAGIPLQVQIDTDPEIMSVPDTRFKIQPNDVGMFMLDIFFSHFVLVTIAIFVWRGIWNVLDHALFPEDLFKSDLVSLAGGYIILILLFMLEYPASKISSCLDKYPIFLKILYEDAIMIVATWAVLMLWRGAWDLLHEYFLPDKLIGGWVSHAIGVSVLLALQGFGNVGTNGIDVDGSYNGGAGIFQTHYIRSIFGKAEKNTKTKTDDKEHLLSEEEEEDEEKMSLLESNTDEHVANGYIDHFEPEFYSDDTIDKTELKSLV